MKVIVLSYLFPNQVYPEFGIFVLKRLKAVAKYCEVKVINPVPWFPMYERFHRYRNFDIIPEKEFINGIEVYHPRFFIIPQFFKFIDAASFCLSVLPLAEKLFKQSDFDIIDLHWVYPDILSGVVLSKFFKKPLNVNVRGMAALNIFPAKDQKSGFYREKSLRSKIIKSLLPYSDTITTVSLDLKKECLKFNIPENRIEVIPNGVDTEEFCYIEKTKCRKELSLPENKRIILSAGNLIYGKGFDRIISIFSEVLKQFPEILYYIIGSEGSAGYFKKELNRLIQKNGLEAKVVFTGQRTHTEMKLWYNAADVFCLSSRTEGSPNVLNEALACGCPAVATDTGAVSEFLKHDFMGKVVENSSAGLKNGLIDVLSSRYERNKISEYMNTHNWDQCAKKVVKMYSRLLTPVPSSGATGQAG